MRSKETNEHASFAKWFKSSYSGSHGECVEVAGLSDQIGMRDTKHRELGALFFGAKEWRSFLSVTRDDLR